MLTFLSDLGHVSGLFHLFRYLTFRTLGAATTGLFLVFFFGPTIISALRLKQGKGQPIRADGPASHLLTKKGTPTMGGLMILSGLMASALLWASLTSPYVWIVLFVTLGFGAIGFYDDYLKVTKQSHLGFSGRARLAGEFAIALAACLAMKLVGGAAATSLALPFINGYVIDLSWAFLVFGSFVIVAFGNAVNLTDGLDGLAIVPVMIAAATLGLISYFAGNVVYSHYLLINHIPNAGEIIVICGAVIGAGVGFLWFNAPPAQIFMGDTGSLALGGLLGTIAVIIKHEVVLAIIGGLFVMEALSVVVQVTSFKLTGKRVFKMAPIHHHFEQLGWSEPQIVMRFWIISFVLAMVGLVHVEAEVSVTPVSTSAGKRVALFGLGGSGLATARALIAGGAEVSAWDDGEASRAKASDVPLVDLSSADWSRFAALVLSPGVPLTHPKPHWTVERAKAAGVEVIGDIELFARERAARAPDAPLVAITGTNGKSTTTALIAHILREAGREVALGGNIGVPVLELPPPAPERVHVIECSSFQIDLAPSLAPSVGLLINLTPDHLDRHGTMENYAAIKERLVAAADTAVVGLDDEYCRDIASRLKAAGRRLVGVSQARSEMADVYVDDHRLFVKGAAAPLIDLRIAPALRGAHNGQNAAFAFASARALGVEVDAISQGLASFPGLAHRMEQVAHKGRVLFVNDSKATNADAAEKALLSFQDIFWILGGKAKEGGVEPLRYLFPRVRKAYLIGAATEDFAATLEGSVAFERCGTLDKAVAAAARDAAASDAAEPVVLLSPACASYDQFANFEARGDAFRALVAKL